MVPCIPQLSFEAGVQFGRAPVQPGYFSEDIQLLAYFAAPSRVAERSRGHKVLGLAEAAWLARDWQTAAPREHGPPRRVSRASEPASDSALKR